MENEFYKLILVTNKNDKPVDKYLEFITQCAESGITSVQLREKKLSPDELFSFARQLKECLEPFKIPLIINDDVELAYKLDAAGVHLGQSDGSIIEARERLGVNKIIGLTINSSEQLFIANALPLDYVGIGSIFNTVNKINVTTIWGTKGLQQITPFSKYPIVAIGGIDLTNAADVIFAGADGIAAIGAFQDAEDPKEATRKLRNIVEG